MSDQDIRGKDVLEVGSMDFNGSLRNIVTKYEPRTYCGVDIAEGPGVDLVCDAESLLAKFGSCSFDLVLCTEVVEHVRDWRNVMHNLKGILRPNGLLLLTTRSKGFVYHGFPDDYWRYEVDDMLAIFSDLSDLKVEQDEMSPGVFVVGRRLATFREVDTSEIELYSVVLHRRTRSLSDSQLRRFRFWFAIEMAVKPALPGGLRRQLGRVRRRYFPNTDI